MTLSEDEDTFFEDITHNKGTPEKEDIFVAGVLDDLEHFGTSEQDLEDEAREVSQWYYDKVVFLVRMLHTLGGRCDEQRRWGIVLRYICILAHLP